MCVREIECVERVRVCGESASVWERDCVGERVCGRGCECVGERECGRECVGESASVWERERECECVGERVRVCGRERECECVGECECVRVCG